MLENFDWIKPFIGKYIDFDNIKCNMDRRVKVMIRYK